jgi:amino acid adenylation domain-containing protein
VASVSSGASNLAELLETSARRTPDAIAVVAPDGASLTYRELDERASRIAGFLRARGVQPGDRVGFCLPKGLASVAVLFGAMKARAAYVPVDWHGPAARNRTIHRDCDVAALFLGSERGDILEGWEPPWPRVVVDVGAQIGKAGRDGFAEALAHAPLPPDEMKRDARRRDDVAYILYTSGSTGVPKGVTITHENALAFVDWCGQVFEPRASDRCSSHAPFHFDLSIFDLYVPIEHGATLFLISEELAKEPKGLARFVEEKKLTLWYSTPSALALLAEFGSLATRDLSALRHVLFAGEVFPVAQLRRLTQLLPHARYWNLYGPTETNVCTFAEIPLPVPPERTQPYPIGPACSHCLPLVLDDAEGEVKRGEEGLLWIAGPSVCRGYWNRPELDAKVFLQRGGKRWYNTGDVVREDPKEGFVYLGRRDRMVKRRGYRIELGEIEAGLHRSPALREAAVVARPDAEAGVKIVAHVSGAAGRPSLVELKRFCVGVLPPYMVPDLFEFHDSLPRTSTGKVDYQALLRGGAIA